MSEKKRILSDADNVLLAWDDAFNEYMQSLGYTLNDGWENKYSLSERFGLEHDFCLQLAMEFNDSEYFRNLPPYKDAQQWVKRLGEEGYEFVIISAMSVDPVTRILRTKNLRRLFGDCIKDVHGLNPTDDKQRVLELWAGSKLFWLEDHFKNAVAGHEVGLRPILIDTGYNAHYHTDLFPRTSRDTPWADIYKIITEANAE